MKPKGNGEIANKQVYKPTWIWININHRDQAEKEGANPQDSRYKSWVDTNQ